VVLSVAPLLRELILHILRIGMLSPAEPAQARLAGVLIVARRRHEDLALPLPQDARALKLAQHWLRQPDDTQAIAALAAGVGIGLRTVQRLFPRRDRPDGEAWRQGAAAACRRQPERWRARHRCRAGLWLP
jgi:hypothetical protein